MATSNPRSLLAALILALPAVQGVPAAPAAKAPGAISLDAQSSELDLRNNNVVFRKVRISQGNMAVSADQGQATGQAAAVRGDRPVLTGQGSSCRTGRYPPWHRHQLDLGRPAGLRDRQARPLSSVGTRADNGVMSNP